MTTICPTNEAELIELFRLAQDRLGWRIVHLQTAFPDAVIENAHGQQLTVEFEYAAKNFQLHGHDPAGCDLVICWCNSWQNATIPVWALEDTLSLDDSLSDRFALRMLYDSMRKARPEIRQESLTTALQQHLTEALQPHLSEAQRQNLRRALADIVRPMLERIAWLQENLFGLMAEESERAGNVIVITFKDGERPKIVKFPFHEKRTECTCGHCGKTWEDVTGYKACSVECRLAMAMKEIDALLAGV